MLASSHAPRDQLNISHHPYDAGPNSSKNIRDNDGDNDTQLVAVGQALVTRPAMLQRTGWLCFSVPGTQGLCLLFPLGPIPHILAVSETLGVAGSRGKAVHRWAGFAAPVARLDPDGHIEQAETVPLTRQQGTRVLQAGLRGLWPVQTAAQNEPTGYVVLVSLREHSFTRPHSLPKVKSASRAVPGPQCPSSQPASCQGNSEGSPASSQA